ncbi:hypothetical protein PHMEG_00017792 [Phytophthora megakarya]|uniref:Testis-expressed sequence 9 protein n=1 Tax=Phytophthora megakarya TaxID=4795 RepID=A0A225VXJ0_9STRA|nr:hypothetical protein PHMEG_00017792 [Phytophthora megakarya]
MNENLAARQEALQRQNQELNQQVEAIEQRRQQLTSGTKSSPSSAATSLSPSPNVRSADRKPDSVSDVDDLDLQSDAKSNLEIGLSASIDSFGSQNLEDARRDLAKSESKENNVASISRRISDKRPQRRHQVNDESSLQDASQSKKISAIPGMTDPVRENDPLGLGLDATVRYQKARLRVLQDEADTAIAQVEQLKTGQAALKAEIEKLKAENVSLTKKNQQTHQLLEKQRELSVAQDDKQRILEGQLTSAQARVEETLRAEKLASQQFRSKDIRLNRALEELEKVKVQLQDEKKNHDDQMVSKAEYNQVVRDNKKLDQQKRELLIAFKRQMKLIDLLKRHRIHMEAAKMLSFTETEFSKTLELG